ncbi:hypothetical protein MH215_28240 [Paenibacillus sp. ACRSA]|uniref:hypothetical protein n=1 Tax=Paenibacillus sp. ACRSA TaxID=2918211 RepID=UPI001EF3D746|nr:hypothetical protein [Paenibacillus sp. ACRSA]MCG7380878.1 hypothetical protein [Paenibacillus sp. ACRSA]
MKKKVLILSLVTLSILLILGNFRWVDLESSVDFRYKYDRWAGQKWVDFYPPLASTNSMEFPLIYIDEINQDTLETYLHKQALSGELANTWVERTRITDGYVGLLLLNILAVIWSGFKLVILRNQKKERLS